LSIDGNRVVGLKVVKKIILCYA